MVNIFFFILLIYFNTNITKGNNIISFKLKTYRENNIHNNISSIIYSLKKSYIYTNIKIGEPEFLLECKLSMGNPHFSMNYIEVKKNEKNKEYDINKSKTFKNIKCLNQFYVQTNKDIQANEKFKMNFYDSEKKINKEIVINNLDFVLGIKYEKAENLSKIYYLSIGLQIFNYNKYTQKNIFNFIYNLKNLNLINDYIWFINFDKETNKKEELNNLDYFFDINQTLLIGDYPHNYKPNEFSKDQIYLIYTNNFLWSFKFKSIFFYENRTIFNSGIVKRSLYDSNCQINFNDIFIYAPFTYLSMIINSFFNNYINKNICHILIDDEIESIYCDKSNIFNLNNLKEFPSLYFEHYEFNYTFEFTYKDLFIETNNKYIFLIVNINEDIDDWFLGKIFFKNYQFFFNTDSKSIGFYNPNIKFYINNNPYEIVKRKNENNSTYIFFIVILSIFLFISFIFIFIYVYINSKNKKRKRANELDDEFDYEADKNIIN